MGTIDYDASRTALYQGGLRATVFAPSGPDPAIDAICAEASRLAYRKFERDRDVRTGLEHDLARVGLNAFESFGSWATGTQAFAVRMRDPKQALVVFRGTEPDEVADLATDLELSTTKWDGDVRVHAGFDAAFESVRGAIEAWLAKHAPLPPIVTGHSLGAALATLAASRWRASRLVTFGCPRVGNEAFAHTIPAQSNRRYVDGCDVVTEIPPEIPNLYVHAGTAIYIDRHGRLQPGWNAERIAIDRGDARLDYLAKFAWRFGNVLMRDLADHAPINYVRAFF